jgi:hypothetical protein
MIRVLLIAPSPEYIRVVSPAPWLSVIANSQITVNRSLALLADERLTRA